MVSFNLYSPIAGPLEYQSASPRNLEDQAAVDARPHERTSTGWSEPFFNIFETDERGRDLLPVNVLVLAGGYLAFLPEHSELVHPVLAPYGVFLPIQTTRGHYAYFRPNHYLDGLDAEESSAKFSDDGKRVIFYRSLVIRNDRINSVGVFKVDELRKGPVLYRPDIVERLLDYNIFTGVEFAQKGKAVEPR
jgi:hypothetical protein